MFQQSFWDIVLNPVVLIMGGLMAAPFLAVLYSLWVTWQDNRNVPEE